MPDLWVDVKGLKGLEDQLLAMGAAAGAKVLRSALMASAKPTADMAKALAPVASKPHTGLKGEIFEPGELKKSIGRRSKLNHYGHAAEVDVGSHGKKAGWYAKFVEFGTDPHFLNRGAKKDTSRFLSGLKYRSAANKRKKHPGAKPHPFLRPAWAATENQAAALFAAKLKKSIERAHKQAAKAVK